MIIIHYFYYSIKKIYLRFNQTFFSRTFDLVANINSGVIFTLFLPNVVLTALAFYNIEHVHFIEISIFCCLSAKLNFTFIPLLYNFQSEFDIVMIAINVICVGCSLIWSSFFAYFATFVTNRISSMSMASRMHHMVNFWWKIVYSIWYCVVSIRVIKRFSLLCYNIACSSLEFTSTSMISNYYLTQKNYLVQLG